MVSTGSRCESAREGHGGGLGDRRGTVVGWAQAAKQFVACGTGCWRRKTYEKSKKTNEIQESSISRLWGGLLLEEKVKEMENTSMLMSSKLSNAQDSLMM